MGDHRLDPAALTRSADDTFTVRRVFGEPYERDGALVVPVARVTGAVGTATATGDGGVRGPRRDDDRGAGPYGTGDAGAGAFGTHVKAVGVFVVDDDGAHWHPALDLNRVILGGQLVGAVVGCAFALAWALRRR
ncbi:MAG: hypothetical protein J7503_12150 [Cellulomonas iranensis]|uniref:Spore protein YtfJ n=1 Tax=Cellulomonas iranensis TaxID=76862 RepID=A0ABU0GFL4_9CELL|nr:MULTISPECIES: hypothetical protein [Cellulomonas]MBO9569563.1 hypothetical protein [Cellulomonas iranensis]MDQ0423729.1 putative spore protein YtfJ [Cellulomonas iranensis]TFH72571.1 hypothetical protein E4A51_03750 [Cellulomonas sp. HD19AZ1]UCN13304.1 hypothetical protein LFM56_10235 [Cellulomonas iranensis]